MKTPQTRLFGTYNAMQVGERGKALTLPSQWCKINNINPRTPLDIFIVEGDITYLIVKPHSKGGK